MNKIIWLVVAVLVVAGVAGGYYVGFDHGWEGALEEHERDEMMEADEMMEDSGSMMENGEEMMEEGETMMEAVKEFKVVGTPFQFDVKEIKVKKGDTVRIVFTNGQGTHDWVVDEFSARTKITQTGETDTVEFVADKTGTFEYYCSVGNHRQMGMVGKLIVE